MEALFDSWRRQCAILQNVAGLIDNQLFDAKPSEDGWPLGRQLCHVHNTRDYWLSRVAPERAKEFAPLFEQVNGEWEPKRDLGLIRAELEKGGRIIEEAVRNLLAQGGGPVGGYDNPVLFLQHMIWHEGWHVGLIMLGLRRAGADPSEDWEEANAWGLWRTE